MELLEKMNQKLSFILSSLQNVRKEVTQEEIAMVQNENEINVEAIKIEQTLLYKNNYKLQNKAKKLSAINAIDKIYFLVCFENIDKNEYKKQLQLNENDILALQNEQEVERAFEEIRELRKFTELESEKIKKMVEDYTNE